MTIIFSEHQHQLAEGPLYHKGMNYWVDIEEGFLYASNGGEAQALKFENEFLSSVVSCVEGGLLVSCTKDLFYVTDMRDIKQLDLTFDLNEQTRFNDAKVDPWGNYWIGSMDLGFEKTSGSLFCLTSHGELKEMIRKVVCSNGLCWNKELHLMYYIDSKTQDVVCYDFDPHEIRLSHKRIIYHESRESVFPDGMCIDRQGQLWVALWDGSSIIQIDPHLKKVTKVIDLPCPKITSCCFTGQDYRQLLVTTSSLETDLKKYPKAGQIFLVDVESQGCETNFFKVEKWI